MHGSDQLDKTSTRQPGTSNSLRMLVNKLRPPVLRDTNMMIYGIEHSRSVCKNGINWQFRLADSLVRWAEQFDDKKSKYFAKRMAAIVNGLAQNQHELLPILDAINFDLREIRAHEQSRLELLKLKRRTERSYQIAVKKARLSTKETLGTSLQAQNLQLQNVDNQIRSLLRNTLKKCFQIYFEYLRNWGETQRISAQSALDTLDNFDWIDDTPAIVLPTEPLMSAHRAVANEFISLPSVNASSSGASKEYLNFGSISGSSISSNSSPSAQIYTPFSSAPIDSACIVDVQFASIFNS